MALSCGSADTDYTGVWSREAEEPGLFLKGSETLTLRPDSTFSITNLMVFSHNDSALDCRLILNISATGHWVKTDNEDLSLNYSLESLEVNPDTSSFRLRALRDSGIISSEISEKMISDLTSGIKDYYHAGYSSFNSAGGMVLKSPEIVENQLFAILNGSTLGWIKSSDCNKSH